MELTLSCRRCERNSDCPWNEARCLAPTLGRAEISRGSWDRRRTPAAIGRAALHRFRASPAATLVTIAGLASAASAPHNCSPNTWSTSATSSTALCSVRCAATTTVHPTVPCAGPTPWSRRRPSAIKRLRRWRRPGCASQVDALAAQAGRFEAMADTCGELTPAHKSLLSSAAKDIRVRLATVQSRVNAMEAPMMRVQRYLQNHEDRSY